MRRVPILASALAIAPALAVACKSEVVSQAELAFRVANDAGALSGFDCNEPPQAIGEATNTPIANRALSACGGPGRISVVVDLIPTDGAVRCDGASLLDYCDAHDCSPSSRTCLEQPLSPGAAPGASASTAITAALHALKGRLVLSSTPTGYDVVRVVATTQPCSAVSGTHAQFDCSSLLGCTNSCPTQLDGFSGNLPLALDLGPVDVIEAIPQYLVDATCAQAMFICARTPFRRGGQCGTRVPQMCP